jgi:hypothetical protein
MEKGFLVQTLKLRASENIDIEIKNPVGKAIEVSVVYISREKMLL